MKIHFIGIGGIGMSALAQYYLSQGWQVSGSDLESSEIIKLLKKKGAKVFLGKHKAKNLPKDTDKVIYSTAVTKDNPELKKAYKIQDTPHQSKLGAGQARYKIQIMSYPQALGELTKKYWTIAVAGTHGKSTTCAMLALILIKAGLNPTVIIGTKLKEFGNSNFKPGGEIQDTRYKIARTRINSVRGRQDTEYLLIEADEWGAAFLNHWPKMIILTNIEREHLDFYKNLKHILKTYGEFIGHLPKRGVLVVNGDDRNISNLKSQISNLHVKSQIYSLKQQETKKLRQILKIPGEHNISNALAALTAARALEIPDKISFQALSDYKGAWRRFEERNLKIENCKLKIVSDYAHHPTEIGATLRAVREQFSDRKIWAIFQPHQYQRTFYLFDDFVKVFKKAQVDKIIITDIYDVAGREEREIKEKVTGEKLARAIEKYQVSSIKYQVSVVYLPFSLKGITNYLKNNLKGGEVVVIMGAGDIYKLVDFFLLTKGQRKKTIK